MDDSQMTIEELDEGKAIEVLRYFFRAKPFVFFGTGMSCALDRRFGMPALTDGSCNALGCNFPGVELKAAG
jgi:hypothetical protein